MLMANLQNENLPNGLKPRSKIVLNLTETQDLSEIKGPLKYPEIDIELLGTYAIQDVIFTRSMFDVIKRDNEFKQFMEVYLGLELRTARVVSDMIRKGLKVVPEIVEEVKVEYSARVAELEKLIFFEASFDPETGKHEAHFDKDGNLHNGLEFNLQSPKQKIAVLIDRLQMPIVHRTETGSPSTDSKKALPKWIEMGYKIAGYLNEWSKLTKVLQSYTDGILAAMDSNGRIHPSFKQTGAKTGRFSCSKPNFQSMPKKGKIRTAFVPEKGYKFICADYSQLELRIAAHFSQDQNMIRAFMEGKDLHIVNAAFAFNKAEEDVTEEERQIAKAIAFGIQYGMGARPDIGVTREKIDAYFEANSGLYSYIETHKLGCRELGYTRTILGRKRRIGKVWSKNRDEQAEAYRELFSAHIQGTAADIMKMAMCEIYDDFQSEGIDATIIAQVHDEILVECADKDVARACEIIQYRMETAFELDGIKLEAAPGVGMNWAEAKAA
jgi:DNA polymerase-1